MAKRAHFGPELFQFLFELSANNDREWFEANKQRYVDHVKEPLLAFIRDFAPHLEKLSPHFVADGRANGGSMFRIYRDVRFSKEKAPYKTHAAAQFRHVAGKDAHAPGFYLHLEAGGIYAGCGVWRPEAEPLKKLRTAVAEKTTAWKRAIGGKAFKDNYELGGDSLTRPPKGFDGEHPAIEDIKRKDFIAGMRFTDAQLFKPSFVTDYAAACRTALPFMRFLGAALEVPV